MATLMGGLSQDGASRHTYAATFPPDHFYCLLDELPLHLIPRRAAKATQVAGNSGRPLFVNPDCVLCRAGEFPDEFAGRREDLSGFALQGTIAWVRDSAAGSLLPFWLGPRLESAMLGVGAGEPAPPALGDDARRRLSAAGILIPDGLQEQRDLLWQRTLEKSATAFRQKGYAPVADLIHPFHIAALRRYYRYLIRTGAIKLGDGQSPRRHVAYNEPVARFFHRSITAKLSALAGQELKPSYVYLASYLSGAELKKHTDREQCEFSITLCLDFSPEPALATPWPIRLDTPAGTVAVHQALGDALAYRGTRVPHYRDALGAGQTSTSIFFHYVPVEFAGSLD
jgi:hypothetical protein